jgi:predicted acetylornithine/succinylornithine family transaminase
MTSTRQVMRAYDRSVLNTYGRMPVAVVRGRGAWLWDAEGRKYLDFFPGFGVGALGHCHPAVVRAIRRQAGRLIHVPNVFFHEGQAALAAALLRLAKFRGRVFFCNSGAETTEAAIKLARRYWQVARGRNKFEIVTVANSFHGRTLGALAATGQKQYQAGFGPMPGGFRHMPLNDLAAAARVIGPRTAGVLIEPILGEGGILLPTKAYLRGLRDLTRRRGALLMFDEVQSGGGRTGSFFAFHTTGVVPDALTYAKPLAGGLPMGALLVREPFITGLTPGTHATTFGGSPLLCAAALAAVKVASAPAFLKRAARMGALLRTGLETLRDRHPSLVKDVRGEGLMLGMELTRPGAPVAARCRELGLLLNCTHTTVIRMLPPMIVSPGEIRTALAILGRVLAQAG